MRFLLSCFTILLLVHTSFVLMSARSRQNPGIEDVHEICIPTPDMAVYQRLWQEADVALSVLLSAQAFMWSSSRKLALASMVN